MGPGDRGPSRASCSVQSRSCVWIHVFCLCRSENVAQEIQELQQKMLDMEKAMEIQAASIDIVTKQACSALEE